MNTDTLDQKTSETTLPDSPRLQEEILLLESELQEREDTIRSLRQAVNTEKNEINKKANELETVLAETEEKVAEQQNEIDDLLQDGIDKEQELNQLAQENEILQFKLSELEEHLNSKADYDDVKTNLTLKEALFEAERKKVSELENEIKIKEQAVLELNYEPDISTTFDSKINQLHELVVLAKKAQDIQNEKTQLEDDFVKNLQYIGELERQVEYYRVGLSPQPDHTLKEDLSYSPGQVDQNETQLDLIKAQEEQIDNLLRHIENNGNQLTMAKENIEGLEKDNEILKSENLELSEKIQGILDTEEKFRALESNYDKVFSCSYEIIIFA